jgi:hypothetical protein
MNLTSAKISPMISIHPIETAAAPIVSRLFSTARITMSLQGLLDWGLIIEQFAGIARSVTVAYPQHEKYF